MACSRRPRARRRHPGKCSSAGPSGPPTRKRESTSSTSGVCMVEQLPRPDVPVPKLKRFRLLARALNATEMAELKPQKRYALAVIFIRAQHAQSLDDAADLFIRLMQNLENNAGRNCCRSSRSASTKPTCWSDSSRTSWAPTSWMGPTPARRSHRHDPGGPGGRAAERMRTAPGLCRAQPPAVPAAAVQDGASAAAQLHRHRVAPRPAARTWWWSG